MTLAFTLHTSRVCLFKFLSIDFYPCHKLAGYNSYTCLKENNLFLCTQSMICLAMMCLQYEIRICNSFKIYAFDCFGLECI